MQRVLLESLAFWVLAIGLFALIFRPWLLRSPLRRWADSTDAVGHWLANKAVLFGALGFVIIGLAGLIWAMIPSISFAAVLIPVFCGVALGILSLRYSIAALARRRR